MIRWAGMLGIFVTFAISGATAFAQYAANTPSESIRIGAREPKSSARPETDLADHEANARKVVADALICQTEGRYREAVLGFTQALARHVFAREDRARVIFDRGVARDALGQLREAIVDYSAAISLSPRFAAALNNRANAYRREGRLALAQRDYRSSLSAGNLTPQYSYYGLGRIAETRGDFAVARDFYGRALRAGPGFVPAAERLHALGEPGSDGNSRIVLRPPTAVARSTTTASARTSIPASAIAPAAYERAESALDLRPAIYGKELKAGPDDPSRIVQLGAWRSEAAAAEGWNRLQREARDALAGLTPRIMQVEIPGRGRFYRLRAVPAARHFSALAVCRSLQSRGLACLVVPAV